MTREQTLESRYLRVQAYGNRIAAALPNARETGLVAYVPLQREHDGKIVRCAKALRAIENELAEL